MTTIKRDDPSDLAKDELEAQGMRRLFEFWFGDEAETVAREMLLMPTEMVDDEEEILSDTEFELLHRDVLLRAARLQGEEAPAQAPVWAEALASAVRVPHHLTELWRGSVSTWHSLAMAGSARLTAGVTMYSGAEAALSELCDSAVLARDIPWAGRCLRLRCARSESGTIRSIKASIETGLAASVGTQLVLELRDRAGSKETITLRPDKPSVTIRPAAFVGDLNELQLTMSVLKS